MNIQDNKYASSSYKDKKSSGRSHKKRRSTFSKIGAHLLSNQADTLKGKFGEINSLTDIVQIAQKGVSHQVFYSFSKAINIPDKYLAELINTSPRTISNYKAQSKTIEPVKGEHLLKLILLFKKGETIFGNLNEFKGWLTKATSPSETLPIERLKTPGGIDLISQELDHIAYGYVI